MADNKRLILASGSPRRREMLENFGITFESLKVEIDESELPGETPKRHVQRLALLKAKAAAQRVKDGWILAADTVVAIDGHILGKPGDVAAARSMLQRLSDRTHQVYTGFCLLHVPGEAKIEEVCATDVAIRKLSPAEIEAYIATGEPFDKAGAYAIQGWGAFMVQSISGSYSNVVGLPLPEVLAALNREGVIDLPKHLESRGKR